MTGREDSQTHTQQREPHTQQSKGNAFILPTYSATGELQRTQNVSKSRLLAKREETSASVLTPRSIMPVVAVHRPHVRAGRVPESPRGIREPTRQQQTARRLAMEETQKLEQRPPNDSTVMGCTSDEETSARGSLALQTFPRSVLSRDTVEAVRAHVAASTAAALTGLSKLNFPLSAFDERGPSQACIAELAVSRDPSTPSALPAAARVVGPDGGERWDPCVVINRDPCSQNYRIRWAHNGLSKTVGRFALRFPAESQADLSIRTAIARSARSRAKQRVYWQKIVSRLARTSIDTAPLSQLALARILRRVARRNLERLPKHVLASLLQEIHAMYRESLCDASARSVLVLSLDVPAPYKGNGTLEERADRMHTGSTAQAQREIPNAGAFPIPTPLARPVSVTPNQLGVRKGVVVASQHVLQQKGALVANKGTALLLRTLAQESAGIAEQQLLQLRYRRCETLDAFQERIERNRAHWDTLLQLHWPESLAKAVLHTFGASDNPSVVAKLAQCESDQLQRFLRLSSLVIAQTLRRAVADSMLHVRNVLHPFLGSVKADAMARAPLFTIRVVVATAHSQRPPHIRPQADRSLRGSDDNDGSHQELDGLKIASAPKSQDSVNAKIADVFTFEPLLHEVAETVLATFDGAVSIQARVAHVQSSLFVRTDDNVITSARCVDDALVASTRQLVEEVLRKAPHHPHAFLQSLKKYAHYVFVAGDLENYVQQFLQRSPTLEQFQELTETFRAASLLCEQEIPNSVPAGLFLLDCAQLKCQLKQACGKIASGIAEALASIARAKAGTVQASYEETTRMLLQAPKSPEQLIEMMKYVRLVERNLPTTSADVDEIRAHYELLEQLDYPVPDEEFAYTWDIYSLPRKIERRVRKCNVLFREAISEFKDRLEVQKSTFQSRIDNLHDTLARARLFESMARAEDHLQVLTTLLREAGECEALARKFNHEEELFSLPQTTYKSVTATKLQIEPYHTLWETITAWQQEENDWMYGDFLRLDPERVRRTIHDTRQVLGELVAYFTTDPLHNVALKITNQLSRGVTEFHENLPLITALRNPGLRERHWDEMAKRTGFVFRPEYGVPLTRILSQHDFKPHLSAIETISTHASRELEVETTLSTIESHWVQLKLRILPGNPPGCPATILFEDGLWDTLDTHAATIATMQLSPYFGAFLDVTREVKKLLHSAREVLNEWHDVQTSWVALRHILTSPDARTSVPLAARKFAEADARYQSVVDTAAKTPRLMSWHSDRALRDMLGEAGRLISASGRGAQEFLQLLREDAPRLYLCSDGEVATLCSFGLAAREARRALSRALPGIHTAILQQENNEVHDRSHASGVQNESGHTHMQHECNIDDSLVKITALQSLDGETLYLEEPLHVSPATPLSGGIHLLENELKRSFMRSIMRARSAISRLHPREWLRLWPQQVCMTAYETVWADSVNELLASGTKLQDVRTELERVRKDADEFTATAKTFAGERASCAARSVRAAILATIRQRDALERLHEEVEGAGHVLQGEYASWFGSVRVEMDGENSCALVGGDARVAHGGEWLGEVASDAHVWCAGSEATAIAMLGVIASCAGAALIGPQGSGRTTLCSALASMAGRAHVRFEMGPGPNCTVSELARAVLAAAGTGSWLFVRLNAPHNSHMISVVAHAATLFTEALYQLANESANEGTAGQDQASSNSGGGGGGRKYRRSLLTARGARSRDQSGPTGSAVLTLYGNSARMQAGAAWVCTLERPCWPQRPAVPSRLQAQFRAVAMHNPDPTVIVRRMLESRCVQAATVAARKIISILEIAKNEFEKRTLSNGFLVRAASSIVETAVGRVRDRYTSTCGAHAAPSEGEDPAQARSSPPLHIEEYDLMSDIVPAAKYWLQQRLRGRKLSRIRAEVNRIFPGEWDQVPRSHKEQSIQNRNAEEIAQRVSLDEHVSADNVDSFIQLSMQDSSRFEKQSPMPPNGPDWLDRAVDNVVRAFRGSHVVLVVGPPLTLKSSITQLALERLGHSVCTGSLCVIPASIDASQVARVLFAAEERAIASAIADRCTRQHDVIEDHVQTHANHASQNSHGTSRKYFQTNVDLDGVMRGSDERNVGAVRDRSPGEIRSPRGGNPSATCNAVTTTKVAETTSFVPAEIDTGTELSPVVLVELPPYGPHLDATLAYVGSAGDARVGGHFHTEACGRRCGRERSVRFVLEADSLAALSPAAIARSAIVYTHTEQEHGRSLLSYKLMCMMKSYPSDFSDSLCRHTLGALLRVADAVAEYPGGEGWVREGTLCPLLIHAVCQGVSGCLRITECYSGSEHKIGGLPRGGEPTMHIGEAAASPSHLQHLHPQKDPQGASRDDGPPRMQDYRTGPHFPPRPRNVKTWATHLDAQAQRRSAAGIALYAVACAVDARAPDGLWEHLDEILWEYALENRDSMPPFPEKCRFVDICFDARRVRWTLKSIVEAPSMERASELGLSELAHGDVRHILLPSPSMAHVLYTARECIQNQMPLALLGPHGAGKTTLLQALRALDEDPAFDCRLRSEYVATLPTYDASEIFAILQATMALLPCAGGLLRPPGKQSGHLLVDDVHVAAPDPAAGTILDALYALIGRGVIWVAGKHVQCAPVAHVALAMSLSSCATERESISSDKPCFPTTRAKLVSLARHVRCPVLREKQEYAILTHAVHTSMRGWFPSGASGAEEAMNMVVHAIWATFAKLKDLLCRACEPKLSASPLRWMKRCCSGLVLAPTAKESLRSTLQALVAHRLRSELLPNIYSAQVRNTALNVIHAAVYGRTDSAVDGFDEKSSSDMVFLHAGHPVEAGNERPPESADSRHAVLGKANDHSGQSDWYSSTPSTTHTSDVGQDNDGNVWTSREGQMPGTCQRAPPVPFPRQWARLSARARMLSLEDAQRVLQASVEDCSDKQWISNDLVLAASAIRSIASVAEAFVVPGCRGAVLAGPYGVGKRTAARMAAALANAGVYEIETARNATSSDAANLFFQHNMQREDSNSQEEPFGSASEADGMDRSSMAPWYTAGFGTFDVTARHNERLAEFWGHLVRTNSGWKAAPHIFGSSRVSPHGGEQGTANAIPPASDALNKTKPPPDGVGNWRLAGELALEAFFYDIDSSSFWPNAYPKTQPHDLMESQTSHRVGQYPWRRELRDGRDGTGGERGPSMSGLHADLLGGTHQIDRHRQTASDISPSGDTPPLTEDNVICERWSGQGREEYPTVPVSIAHALRRAVLHQLPAVVVATIAPGCNAPALVEVLADMIENPVRVGKVWSNDEWEMLRQSAWSLDNQSCRHFSPGDPRGSSDSPYVASGGNGAPAESSGNASRGGQFPMDAGGSLNTIEATQPPDKSRSQSWGAHPGRRSGGRADEYAVHELIRQRVQDNVRLVLCVDDSYPEGRALLSGIAPLRENMSLIRFEPCESETLSYIAKERFARENADFAERGSSCVAAMFLSSLQTATRLQEETGGSQGRAWSTTPPLRLFSCLLSRFVQHARRKRARIGQRVRSLATGLEKLLSTAKVVNDAKHDLRTLKPLAEEAELTASELQEVVSKLIDTAAEVRRALSREEDNANRLFQEVKSMSAAIDSRVRPTATELERASQTLRQIGRGEWNDISELKRPSIPVLAVAEACVQLVDSITAEEQPVEAGDQGVRWHAGLQALALHPAPGAPPIDVWTKFLHAVTSQDFSTTLPRINWERVSSRALGKSGELPSLGGSGTEPDGEGKAGRALRTLAGWLRAAAAYHGSLASTQRERVALSEQQEQLNIATRIISTRREAVKKAEDEVAETERRRTASLRQAEVLRDELARATRRLDHAQRLAQQLQEERAKWRLEVEKLNSESDTVNGDVLLASCVDVLSAAFPPAERQALLAVWKEQLREYGIAISSQDSPAATLLAPEIAASLRETASLLDAVSADAAAILCSRETSCTILDPHGAAEQWLAHEASRATQRAADEGTLADAPGAEMQHHSAPAPPTMDCLPVPIVRVSPCMSGAESVRAVNEVRERGGTLLVISPTASDSILESINPAVADFVIERGDLWRSSSACAGTGRKRTARADRVSEAADVETTPTRIFVLVRTERPPSDSLLLARAPCVNFALSEQGLCARLQGAVARVLLRREYEHILLARSSAETARRHLARSTQSILDIIISSGDDFVENTNLSEILCRAKQSAKNAGGAFERHKSDYVRAQSELREKLVWAANLVGLFTCVQELHKISPLYDFSLEWFENLMSIAIEQFMIMPTHAREPRGNEEAGRGETLRGVAKNGPQGYRPGDDGRSAALAGRLGSECAAFILEAVHKAVDTSLLRCDRRTFLFMLTLQALQESGVVPRDELALLREIHDAHEARGIDDEANGRDINPAPEWISEKMWSMLCRFARYAQLGNFIRDFTQDADEWRKVLESRSPGREVLPGEWEERLSGFQRLLLVYIFRPDRLVQTVDDFSAEFLPYTKEMQEASRDAESALSSALASSHASRPILLLVGNDVDPSAAIRRLARQTRVGERVLQFWAATEPVDSLRDALEEAVDLGRWMIVYDCHLSFRACCMLETALESVSDQRAHAGFRLWLCSGTRAQLPRLLVQRSSKVALEGPHAVRSVIEAMHKPLEQIYQGPRGDRIGPLAASAAIALAIARRRAAWGTVAFERPYAFSVDDIAHALLQAVRQTCWNISSSGQAKADGSQSGNAALSKSSWQRVNWVLEVPDGPDAAIISALVADAQAMLGDSREGGRLQRAQPFLVHPNSLKSVPWLMRAVIALSVIDQPDTCGLHISADASSAVVAAEVIVSSTIQALRTLEARRQDSAPFIPPVALTAPTGVPWNEALSFQVLDEDTEKSCREFLDKIPSCVDAAGMHDRAGGVRDASAMDCLLSREAERYNVLVGTIRATLLSLLHALDNAGEPTRRDMEIGRSISRGEVPRYWQSLSYPSTKPLGLWVNDLRLRLAFITQWIEHGAPSVLWISGLFCPEELVPAICSDFASANALPPDVVDVATEVMPHDHDLRQRAPVGIYIRGMFLQGARWDHTQKALTEPFLSNRLADMPVLWMRPRVTGAGVPPSHSFRCPVYRTPLRADFLFAVELPTEEEPAHWAKRGCALLCSLP